MPAIQSVGQIAIPVKDISRAVKFYRDVLGMQFLFEAPPELAFFNCGGVRIFLDGPAGKASSNASSVLYFKVADINASFAGFKSAGVEFIDEPHPIAKLPDHELWMTFFKDTEGNTLALMSEVR